MRFRRGFAVNPGSICVLVLFLVVACGHLLYAMNDPRWHSKALGPFLLKFTFWPLVTAGILALVSWLISRRSDRVANGVFCVLLLLMICLRVAVMSGLLARSGSARPPDPRETAGLNASQSADGGPTSRTSFQRAPTTASTPEPAAPSEVDASERPSAPPPGVSPRSTNPNVQAVLEAIKSELEGEIASVWPDVERAFADWSRPPPHDLSAIEDRVTRAELLKSAAAELAKRLREVPREARTRMEQAGIEPQSAQAEAGRFMVTYNAAWRATAFDAVVRAADRVIDEASHLKQGFSKWRIGPDGSLDSDDAAFKGQAFGKRSAASFAVRDSEGLRKRLGDRK